MGIEAGEGVPARVRHSRLDREQGRSEMGGPVHFAAPDPGILSPTEARDSFDSPSRTQFQPDYAVAGGSALAWVEGSFQEQPMNAVYRANGCLLALALISILTVIGFAALTA